MNRISKLAVAESIIESAYNSHQPQRVAVLWSGGKDSTALLFMINRLYGKIPFTVVYGDLNFDNPVLDRFVKDTARRLSFSFLREEILDRKTVSQLRRSHNSDRLNVLVDMAYAQSVTRLVREKKIRAFIFGNRYSESGKNNAFVKKDSTATNYYPLLQMTDMDMWEFTYRNRIPFLGFYRRGWRRTAPIMFFRQPSLLNHLISVMMHTYLQIRYG